MLKKYISIFKDNLLLEMSKYRMSALIDIKGLMKPLLTHLIIVNEMGPKYRDYSKHMKEIQNYRNLINKYNRKGKNGKWFGKDFLNNLSEDHIERTIEEVNKKYSKLILKQEYKSLKDFVWFKIFDK